LLALEVSQVVDSRDVQRAHDRAEILSRIGVEAIAAVGGSRVTADATQLAEQLGVRTVINSLDEP
jgi:argininosuccinate lyase